MIRVVPAENSASETERAPTQLCLRSPGKDVSNKQAARPCNLNLIPFEPPSINEQALREDVIEQVTRRVVERMADAAVRQVVLDVAERLVREEIDRIKGSGR